MYEYMRINLVLTVQCEPCMSHRYSYESDTHVIVCNSAIFSSDKSDVGTKKTIG